MTTWDCIGWGLVAATVWTMLPIWFAFRAPRRIGDVPPADPKDPDLPFVSIIVPARQEGASVEAALTTLLSLDYPRYEVIAIDDRSTDATGEIMERISASDPRCRVLHVTELPQGWLGKNHANWLGARLARGDLLLFTDGDVHLDPPVLGHAAAAMRQLELDHLVLFPKIPPGGFGESVAMCHFSFLFCAFTKFSMAQYRWLPGAFVGVGAFNLVTRAAYQAIGTHERLRLEVADDLMLGKLVKRAGFRQRALLGMPMVRVKWQQGLMGVVRGLEKNAFAAVHYSVVLAVGGVLLHPLSMIAPIVLAVTGPAQLQFAIIVALTWASYVVSTLANPFPLGVAFCYPLASLLFAYIFARSTFVTMQNGGVTWRDTFCPLS
ncbi:MAG: glycosyltransferase, partial [Candidatus Riflebacteria bacterium]|nr:glycosyltransferase [Candidatus Riflebacteria bacterium]